MAVSTLQLEIKHGGGGATFQLIILEPLLLANVVIF